MKDEIICPHCKSNEGYAIGCVERYSLFFNSCGEGEGRSDGNVIYENKIAECQRCHKGFRIQKKIKEYKDEKEINT